MCARTFVTRPTASRVLSRTGRAERGGLPSGVVSIGSFVARSVGCARPEVVECRPSSSPSSSAAEKPVASGVTGIGQPRVGSVAPDLERPGGDASRSRLTAVTRTRVGSSAVTGGSSEPARSGRSAVRVAGSTERDSALPAASRRYSDKLPRAGARNLRGQESAKCSAPPSADERRSPRQSPAAFAAGQSRVVGARRSGSRSAGDSSSERRRSSFARPGARAVDDRVAR